MKIKLSKDTRSCNVCNSINFTSPLPYDGKVVERLYDLRIGYTVICLCEDCLRELPLIIGDILNTDHPKEKGGAEE